MFYLSFYLKWKQVSSWSWWVWLVSRGSLFFCQFILYVHVCLCSSEDCRNLMQACFSLSLSGYFRAPIAVVHVVAAGPVCGAAGTVNAGGLCGVVVVFVLNAEYHADKPQSFTCNRVDGEVQLESKPAPKAAPFHTTLLHCLSQGIMGRDLISVLTLVWEKIVWWVAAQPQWISSSTFRLFWILFTGYKSGAYVRHPVTWCGGTVTAHKDARYQLHSFSAAHSRRSGGKIPVES